MIAWPIVMLDSHWREALLGNNRVPEHSVRRYFDNLCSRARCWNYDCVDDSILLRHSQRHCHGSGVASCECYRRLVDATFVIAVVHHNGVFVLQRVRLPPIYEVKIRLVLRMLSFRSSNCFCRGAKWKEWAQYGNSKLTLDRMRRSFDSVVMSLWWKRTLDSK